MNPLFNSLAVLQYVISQVTGVAMSSVTTATPIPANTPPGSPQFSDFHLLLQARLHLTIPLATAKSWATVADAEAYLNSLDGGEIIPNPSAS